MSKENYLKFVKDEIDGIIQFLTKIKDCDEIIISTNGHVTGNTKGAIASLPLGSILKDMRKAYIRYDMNIGMIKTRTGKDKRKDKVRDYDTYR